MRSKQGCRTEGNKQCLGDVEEQSREMLGKMTAAGNQSEHPHGLTLDSDYHTNINIEMNYWGVDAANLQELFEPLGSWLVAANRTAAKETRKAFPESRGVAYRTSMSPFGGGSWKWNFAGAAAYSPAFSSG